MKKLLIFLIISQFANSQTPFSFYPAFNPTEAGLSFGSKVDLDGNEIIASNQRTVVYVFDKNTNGVQQKQIIYSPNASDGTFGYSISIDNNFIAIGDPLINSVAEDAGSVFIYNKTADLYDLQQIIPSPEPTANYHFGSCVKVFGNKLFITAQNKVYGFNASSNDGSVYYYLFNGTEWVFQQKLITDNTYSSFGNKIEINDNLLAIRAQYDPDSFQGVSFFKLIDGNYTFNGYAGYTCLEGNFDFSLHDSSLYILSNRFINTAEIVTQGQVNIIGFFEIAPEIDADHIFGTIAASNDDIFFGSTSYILQQSRKFPLLHYKRNGNTWTYYNTYNGIQPSGDDDFFGSALAIKDNLLIIGAPLERIILPSSGNIYYLDYLLANEKFERNGFSLFPNPTNDRVFLRNNNSLEISKIEIYSVSGKLLQTQNNNFNEISLENFSSGLYFAKIYSQNEVSESFKIVKN